MGLAMLLFATWGSWSTWVHSTPDCSTITALVSACSTFITYGSPDPYPGTPCCDAMASLNTLADTTENRRLVCRCLMGLITTYNPNATAIATLPGLCGVYLGFTIDPNIDCNTYVHSLRPSYSLQLYRPIFEIWGIPSTTISTNGLGPHFYPSPFSYFGSEISGESDAVLLIPFFWFFC